MKSNPLFKTVVPWEILGQDFLVPQECIYEIFQTDISDSFYIM
jgi:hypothetical protein